MKTSLLCTVAWQPLTSTLLMEGEDDVPSGYIDEEETVEDTGTPLDPVERDAERGFGEEELAACMKVLQCLGEKPNILNRRDYRDLRRAAGY